MDGKVQMKIISDGFTLSITHGIDGISISSQFFGGITHNKCVHLLAHVGADVMCCFTSKTMSVLTLFKAWEQLRCKVLGSSALHVAPSQSCSLRADEGG